MSKSLRMSVRINARFAIVFFLAALVLQPLCSAQDPAPQTSTLKGDGVQDDTAAIQKMLDDGGTSVRLPKPEKSYLIAKTLILHSGQTLELDRCAVVRLADHADVPMLANADSKEGDRGVSVIGGIWDGNNAGQTPHDFTPNVPYDAARHIGVVMRFDNVKDLRLANLTLKDPESFAVQLGNIERFSVEDITFDYNLLRMNMDGIHLNGNCRQGRIANIKGMTNDDMIALNADDGAIAEMSRGPISDIVVDSIFAENGYTAVRLLSAGNPVRRVRISNIFGSYRYNVVSFTQHQVHPGEPSTFEDVAIDGIFCSKPTQPAPVPLASDEWGRKSAPLIWIAEGVHAKNVTISNMHRTEMFQNASDSIVVDANAVVDCLTLSNLSLVNNTSQPISVLTNRGAIHALNAINISASAATQPPPESVIVNKGEIGQKNVANLVTLQLEN